MSVKNKGLLKDDASFLTKESYVKLRTNFIYTTMNGARKKILFTSCEPGDGKTTVLLNLAQSLSQSGKKIIVLDCDLRRSKMRHYLHVGEGKLHGLVDVLSNIVPYQSSIYHMEDAGFDVIFKGGEVPNPSVLLESENMQKLIEQLETQYDYVLLDTPPLLSVSDAAILSKVCDGAILVARHDVTKSKQLRFALQDLKIAGVNLIGTVLNQYNYKKDLKYYGYGKSYYYNYYSYESDT